MRRSLALAASLALPLLAPAQEAPAPSPAPAGAEPPLVHFVSDPATDPGYDIDATEFERTANTSKVRVEHRKGAPRGSLVLATKAFYQIAKARHAAYFMTLDEKMNKDASWTIVIGFPDTPTPNLETAFDRPYKEKNLAGKKRVCFSVAECAVLFENESSATSSAPASPATP